MMMPTANLASICEGRTSRDIFGLDYREALQKPRFYHAGSVSSTAERLFSLISTSLDGSKGKQSLPAKMDRKVPHGNC